MKRFFPVAVLLLIGGCAWGPLVVKYPFPAPGKAKGKTGNSPRVAVAPFVYNDKPVAIGVSIIRNQPTLLGAYTKKGKKTLIHSQNRIDELFGRIFTAELERAGYRVVKKKEADVVLKGRIDSFSASLVRTREDYLLANVQVYIEVLSAGSGSVLYKNHYLAGAMLETTDPPDDWDFVTVLENGLVRIMRKIMKDKDLFAALQT